jgi:hypothetical protein
MPTLYEYYNSDDDTNRQIYDFIWASQTFTPSVSHKITSVKLKIWRFGSCGTITVSIRATSSGLPTGSDLCSGTRTQNDISQNTSGEWHEITLGSGYDLVAGTKYAIVVRAPSGNSSNNLYWRSDQSSPTYSGGTYCHSSDYGASWSVYASEDTMFEEWGEPQIVSHYLSLLGVGG